MRYLSAKFSVILPNNDANLRQTCLDLVSSFAGEAGFESFEEQDGHLVGALTHALTHDPAKGYALYIDFIAH